ncbi:MAG: hypothetical protein J6B53_02390 [Clostridia bacterium]|nr:hypothetical protein [Clostridia bacterium]
MTIHLPLLKRILPLLLVSLLGCLLLTANAEGSLPVLRLEAEVPLETASLPQERAKVWEEYCESVLSDPLTQQEIKAQALSLGEVTMRYSVSVIGEKPQSGYPLYIAMHGGGSSDTPDSNNAQWDMMKSYYRDSLDCGVYVAVRGVRDTWDTHFNPESYPLYDRLIRNMILTMEVDPNRVYLLGFSAGGDGVYAIAPRMADRFAAANMSSGHPNGISLLNLYNLPIQLQAGEFDDAYDRNTVTADYGMKLDALQAEYGGYLHRTLIHVDCGHNFEDWDREPIPVMRDPAAWRRSGDRSTIEVDSFPPDYMDEFVRSPIPPRVIWDLGTRASTRSTESFYYLRAPYSTDAGLLTAALDRAGNAVRIECQDLNGPFSLLLSEDMVDFSRPVLVTVNGESSPVSITPDRRVLVETTHDRGDPFYQFEAEIPFDADGHIAVSAN